MTELILSNAVLVLPDTLIDGTLTTRGKLIADVQPGRSTAPGALDLGGDYLLPGIVDVHTDNLERQVEPRIRTRWPSRSAMLAHDAQCAVSGVTTVLDALCLGDLGFDESRMRTSREAVADLDALTAAGLLRSEHYLHLRCELPAEDMLEMAGPLLGHALVRMVSLMDHSPGVGQYADLAHYRDVRRRHGATEIEIESRISALGIQRERLRGPNRRALLDRLRGLPVAIASHDDRTADEIAENVADGVTISEFPVSMEAARAARAAGMRVIAGAPNVVRGRSHSGNVAAHDLIAAGAVDALASDYVPSAMVEAAFKAAESGLGVDLPRAVAMVTAEPAAMAGLADRGRLGPGLRADLVQVRLHEGVPVVRAVWRAGQRVG
jgi:alpha-D-ribose 1-methylphosphonate 5-triphosphate diphosphatase